MNNTFFDKLDEEKKLFEKGIKKIDLVKDYIKTSSIKNVEKTLFDISNISEKIANIGRGLPILSGINYDKEILNLIILNEYNMSLKINERNWIIAELPLILPKKESGNSSFIRSTVFSCISDFLKNNHVQKRDSNQTIIFEYHYDQSIPEKEYRDHDNIEVNTVIDLFALYFLKDDGGLKLRHYYKSMPDNKTYTKIFLIPNSDFIYWLSKYN